MTNTARIEQTRVAEALRHVLASRTFARSERLRSFLKFVVEMEQLGLAHQLKGYTIGIDVFSRDEGFDPGTDPLVRVHAGKLRKLLNQFYADEGRNETLRIRIPLGGYVPVYEDTLDTNWDREAQPLSAVAIPMSSGMPAFTSHSTTIADLPNITVVNAQRSDRRAGIFLQALGTESHWAVALNGRQAERQGRDQTGSAALQFELHIEVTDDASDRLSVWLRHTASNIEVPSSRMSIDITEDNLVLAMAANQFASTNLTIPGHVYRFCNKRGLSSGLMLCLEATYRYKLEQTDDAFQQARRHQQRWSGMRASKELITEIPRLITLSCLAN
ncbi:hypothetical protein [Rhizobium sp. AAP43]|uniref:hypothetical protein n=1 Tax=Rhizobium sp. AAP43 TaxID=1523420 RepID=UPI0006B946D2|nr:hypothetical protein [Rhizobium sp. AAP43]KPF42359.1 hypothetical protein IP76_17070 [Rhizobium sp. AAP43]